MTGCSFPDVRIGVHRLEPEEFVARTRRGAEASVPVDLDTIAVGVAALGQGTFLAVAQLAVVGHTASAAFGEVVAANQTSRMLHDALDFTSKAGVSRTCICGGIGAAATAAFLLFLGLLVFIAFPLPVLPGDSTLIGVSALPDSDSFLSGSKSSGGNGGASK